MDKRPRILFVGDGGVHTGFARIMTAIIRNLPKDKYDIHHLAINYMGDPWPDAPAPMYPAMIGGDMMGYGRLPRLLTYLKPDLVFMLNDVWALRDYLDRIPVEQKVVTYFPVDAVPLQKEWCTAVAARSIPVAYTKFGKSAVQKFAASANIRVIPHGIDTTTFYPIDTLQARSFLNSVTPEDFIVFNGNRNQPRKRIDLTIKGFALFADNKPKTVKIYLHMGVNDAGWNIITLCERYGIADRLLLTSLQLAPDNGVSDERLNQIYNACDVGLNTCYLPDTVVLTDGGPKKIQDVMVGETVFSHTGSLSQVTKTFEYNNDAEIIKLTAWGLPALSLTKNHELFADIRQYTKSTRIHKNEIRNHPQPRFIRAEHLLEGSILMLPVIKKETRSIGEETAFIYGAYLAEGCTSKAGIRFCLNSGDSDNELRSRIIECMRKVYSLEPHIHNYPRNRQVIEYYSQKLKTEFETKFKIGARNKTVPRELLFLPRKEKVELLKAYLLGDGHISHKEHSLSYCTTSENLAWSVWFMLTTLGQVAPCIEQKSRGEFVVKIFGNSARELANLFNLALNTPHRQQRDKTWADEKYVYYPIKEMSRTPYIGKIYDLEVSGEHSYVTYVAGHNSTGEGWGLVSFEHGACKKAQVLPYASANIEIYADNGGYMIPIDHEEPNLGILTNAQVVSPEGVAATLEECYNDPNREARAEQLFNFIKQPQFDWANIGLQWDKVFEEALE